MCFLYRLVAVCARLVDCFADNPVQVATLGRTIFDEADKAGHIAVLKEFGVQFVTDTCWCMLTEPVVPIGSKTLITNSGKYAHYAPGLVNRRVRFSNLRGCVEAAATGRAPSAPAWVTQQSRGLATYTHSSSTGSGSGLLGRYAIQRWQQNTTAATKTIGYRYSTRYQGGDGTVIALRRVGSRAALAGVGAVGCRVAQRLKISSVLL